MTTFSSEQLNFFKFSTVVLDEFPVALRQVFVYMWDNQVAPTPAFQKWDDSLLVRNMFLSKEGGKTKYVPTSKSYLEWDCTALFEATLYAQSFAIPDGKGGFATLDKLYVKPRFLPRGAFHLSVLSPSGNQAETFALSLDQLRLLRNSLCHQTSTQKFDKATFDHYIRLAKYAFAALGLRSKTIDDVGRLGEKDFPTDRVQQLEEELRREKFKQIEDNLDKIEAEVKYVGSDVKDIKRVVTEEKAKVEEVGSYVTDVKTKLGQVGSDVKMTVTDVKRKLEEVGSNVKAAATDVKTNLGQVGSDVKMAVTDVKTKLEEVGSDVKLAVTDVKTKAEEVGSDVKTEVTDVKTKVEEVGSDVKSAVTDVKTKVERVRSDLTEVKANVDEIKQAMQAGISKGPFVPDSCIPDKIPNFVGRQEECRTIEDHLTNGITRLINVWGPPGFGKTSVAINVAHHLQDMKIPVYFAPIRGMESKEQLVSKLLSIFADDAQVRHISASHWLIQCLQQVQNPFVLILDNADDLLESEDAKQKQHVLRFIDETLTQCKHMKLLLTTRESLDYLSHTRPVHLEKINVLDEVSSVSLVKRLLPNISDDDCRCLVKECGQVPLSMRLMCSMMREEDISISELSEELKNSTLVKVLDSESFPDDSRLKTIINTSFQRLTFCEKSAFVTLSVFPGWFRIEEATAVLDTKTDLRTKKIIRSLERKSLVDCEENFSYFRIHSLFHSFIEEERKNDQSLGAVFLSAQRQFYDYFITSFTAANEKFLIGPSNEASTAFVDRRECILLSLANGIKDDNLYRKIVEVLSKAELFLCALLPDEEAVFERLYDKAVQETRRRQIVVDEWKLLSAKSFRYWGWFSSGHQTWDHLLYAGGVNEDDYPAKLIIYHGVYQLLCGKQDEGMSSLLRSVDRLSSCSDEHVLKGLIYCVLTGQLERNDEMSSYFEGLFKNWCKFRLVIFQLTEGNDEMSLHLTKDDDTLFFILWWKLTSSLTDEEYDQTDSFFSMLYKIAPAMCGNRRWRSDPNAQEMLFVKCILKESKEARLILQQWFPFIDDDQLLDSEKLAQVESVCLHFLEFIDQILQSGLNSTQTYNTTKHLMESLLHLFRIFGVSPNSQSFISNFSVGDAEIKFKWLSYMFGNVLNSNEKIPGRDFVDLARRYDDLGMIKHITGDYSGAIRGYQQAIRLREESVADHIDTFSSLKNMGLTLFSTNNAIKADKALQSALDLRETFDVDGNMGSASSYFTLGENHCILGKYEKALKPHLQTLKLEKKHLREHALTAKAINEVGRVYFSMKSYSEALEFCEKALAMRLELLGEHVDTAASFDLLGRIHFKMGEKLSAVQEFEVAAVLRSNLLGEHEETACSYHILGEVQNDLGDHKRASQSFQKAADMRYKLLGDHHDTACSYHSLGNVQRDMRDHKRALMSFQKAAEIRYNLLGDHEDMHGEKLLLAC